ncbi:hypothetical protein ACFXTH_015401 [Malus domestica]
MDDFPPYHFRCPISIELMKDPVTISTGVTYERNNIEKWFFSYKKKTCPATMQSVKNFDMIPNHTHEEDKLLSETLYFFMLFLNYSINDASFTFLLSASIIL